MSGALVLSGAPSSGLHAATKTYSDSYVAGLEVNSSALSSIANNQVLGWNSATSKWAPLTVVGAADATAIQGTNVDSGAPTTAKVLVYDTAVASKWAPATLAAASLASDSVTTVKILDSNVTTAKLASSSVTAAVIGSDAVTTTKILDSNVTTAKLASSSVTAAVIGSDAVTTTKILDAAVTAAKISGYLPGTIIGQLTFSTTNVVIKSGFQTVVNSTPVSITADTNVAWSGAAGWRYVVLSSAGAATIETIPVAEITADTARYTPAPVFNGTLGGYYSTVNTTKRIVGIARGDGTNFLEVITYGNGRNKNDNYIVIKNAAAPPAGKTIQRFTTAVYTRGDGATWTDDTVGTDGTKITINRPGKVMMGAGGILGCGGCNSTIQLNPANFADSTPYFADSTVAIGTIASSNGNFFSFGTNVPVPVSPGDVLYVFANGGGAQILDGTANYARMWFYLEEY